MRKKIFILLFLISTTYLSSKSIELKNIENPLNMKTDKLYIYITDNHSIKVFSRKDIKYIKTIGRKGLGPKEFQFPPRFQIVADGIFAFFVNKIYLINSTGIFIKEKKLNVMYTDMRKLDNKFVVAKVVRKPDDNYLEYFFANQDFKQNKSIYTHKWNNHIDGTRELFDNSFFGVFKKKIFFVGDKKIFKIDIIDINGNLVKTIEQKTESIAFKTKNRAQFYKEWEKQKIDLEFQKKIVRFPKSFPKIFDIKFSNNKVYVLTYKMKNGKRECYVYNSNLNFINHIFIPLKSDTIISWPIFSIEDDHIYQLLDNEEDETWDLYITKLKTSK